MIFLSRKAVNTAGERIASFAGMSEDDVAKKLREFMAVGEYLDKAKFESEREDTKALVLPADVRTTLGDRLVVLIVDDQYTPGETVAVVVKPLRSVLKAPARVKNNERLVSMPKLPTLEELVGEPPAPPAVVVEAQPVVAPPVRRAPPLRIPGKRRSPVKQASPGMSRGAALLRNEILKRGAKVKDAAESFGFSAWQFTRWQCGQQVPDAVQAAHLERSLGIPLLAWSQEI
jgi:hypothetical protein